MKRPLLGISLMPETDFLKAVLPLFQNGDIEVLEWSFDTIIGEKAKPLWLKELLKEYSDYHKLIGHGVYYSLFAAKWSKGQENWLKQLKKEVSIRNYNHITEHFGFMSNNIDHHKGCPFPVPLNKKTLAIGIDRLMRLQDATKLPIGIENLAFSFTKTDVEQQGDFLKQLIEPINGFIILDLHNIYCQAENFAIDMMELISYYPLDAVKEIHISGGSFAETVYQNKVIEVRRDTHDGDIPQQIFDVLPKVLALCRHVEYVIFERMGNSFTSDDDCLNYRRDFIRLKNIVENGKMQSKIWGNNTTLSSAPIEDEELSYEQNLLSKTLLAANSYKDVLDHIKLKNWSIENWEPKMIDTAIAISKKWN